MLIVYFIASPGQRHRLDHTLCITEHRCSLPLELRPRMVGPTHQGKRFAFSTCEEYPSSLHARYSSTLRFRTDAYFSITNPKECLSTASQGSFRCARKAYPADRRHMQHNQGTILLAWNELVTTHPTSDKP